MTTILCIHGFMATKHSFAPFISSISKPCIAIDLPGYGNKPALKNNSIQNIIPALRPVLKQHQPIHLFGTSLGGTICLLLAQYYPQYVKSCSVNAPCLDPGVLPMKKLSSVHVNKAAQLLTKLPVLPSIIYKQLFYSRRASAIKNMQARIPGLLDTTQNMLLSSNHAAMLQLILSLYQTNIAAALQHITMPIQVIWGTDDHIIPINHASYLQPLPKYSLEKVPLGSHYLLVEKPQLMADLVTAFIDNI